ncbi:HAD family hydrolase [Vagococcus fluvialis]|uniref:HAD-IIIA family hydrolase n=1 Tax=Vagococcus fluvialis TaxID=2738 RepID=A0A7X6D959_9ENTE|nr:HAD-IIIA family hydrolase [Vagococcus fluvialis]NKC68116.1 HAD-IIIA family hydrolase [Vagococcus fluvialis]
MKEWIFFDVGETLVNEYNSYEEHFTNCCLLLNSLGIYVTPKEYREKIESAYKENNTRPLHHVWQSLNVFVEKPKWSHDNEVLYSGVPEVLDKLSKNYSLGVIANQGEGLTERLKEYGIEHYFKVIISSADVGIKKPNLEIFEQALLEANISPKEAIYVGDRVDNDIIPSKKIGMRAIRIKQGLGKFHKESETYPSDMIINDLSELLCLLD